MQYALQEMRGKMQKENEDENNRIIIFNEGLLGGKLYILLETHGLCQLDEVRLALAREPAVCARHGCRESGENFRA